ncbi:ribonucleotide reductase subunit B [Prochlorococcus phage Syn33]|uniref:Ribonucleotide reductase subunit B n=1 Tax=Prochlorococcus phage Syn33 TaxID=444878 RepID=E3SR80_9CAUD|nr:ribonucleotide reductase subunit B [Prochlorococcus phage Syn33]ADO99590.1 ribonucleotide reductase subunit B [Prochlorococcus phage Syn33]
MSPAKSELQGMTVFNKNKVDTKKQPMFFWATSWSAEI